MRTLPYDAAANGLRVAIKVTPKAARAAIGDVGADADGNAFLRVAVTAAPERGKANAAVIKLLARAWRLAPSALSITGGATARRKTLHVAGDTPVLLKHLNEWIETHHV
jgi:uncharacterized protein YggU (UPF0235/DUF167 family)